MDSINTFIHIQDISKLPKVIVIIDDFLEDKESCQIINPKKDKKQTSENLDKYQLESNALAYKQ